MRVLLRFCQSIVLHTYFRPNFSQHIVVLMWWEGDWERERSVIHGKANQIELWSIRNGKLLKVGNRQRPSELSCPVRPKIKEDDRIAVAHGSYGFAIAFYEANRLKKFVGNSFLI